MFYHCLTRGRLFCEPQKIPAKKSKNGHNALLMAFITCGVLHICEYPRNFLSNRANQRESDSDNFNSFSEFLTHKRSRELNRFVKNGKANFGSPIESNPKYSGQKKPKWIFHLTSTEISGISGRMKTPAVFLCWCTAAWQVRLWKFFLSFFISSN